MSGIRFRCGEGAEVASTAPVSILFQFGLGLGGF